MNPTRTAPLRAVLSTVVAVLAILLLPASRAAAQLELRIERVVGQAVVRTPSGEIPPREGLLLRARDRLEVAEGRVALAGVKLGTTDQPDQCMVVVAADSTIAVLGGAAPTDPSFALVSGAVRVVQPNAKGVTSMRWQIGGDDAPIVAMWGADVIAELDADGSGRMMVHEGRARLESGDRRMVVNPMMWRSFAGDGAVLAARKLDEPTWKDALARADLPGLELPVVGEPQPRVIDVADMEKNKLPEAFPADALVENGAYVVLRTSLGEITIELDAERSPISTENFLAYAEKGFYDGTIFHRVVRSGISVVQGGGFTADMAQKTADDPIKNEWLNGYKNLKGTLAMARTSAPDSATSQFYINTVDNRMLDVPRGGAAYAVFGRVIAGMDVVEKIQAVPTTSRAGHQDVPAAPIAIEKAERIDRAEAERRFRSS